MESTVESLVNNPEASHFDALYEAFRWQVPDNFNIAEAVCRRHADGSGRLALIACNESGAEAHYSFDTIDQWSAQLATVLADAGVERGDRVAVILPQRVETALLHLAAQRLGAISLPLSVMFGDDALAYRLKDSGTRVVVLMSDKLPMVTRLSAELPDLKTVMCIDEEGPVAATYTRQHAADTAEPIEVADTAIECLPFWPSLLNATAHTDIADTRASDAALILYTSGTTGPPKGALIPQQALIGNLTGFELSHDGFPKPNDVVHTPADWAWTGGLMDGLLPAWYYGVPIVAMEFRKFQPEQLLSLMSRHKVTCTFLPPTALKMLRSHQHLLTEYPLSLRSIMSAGETVGAELVHWAKETFGVTINEMCGQTEHNYLMGNSACCMEVKPGSMGKAYPGHRVAIMGTDGKLLGDNEEGELVAHRDDPVHFLGYWQRAEATAKKYTGDWFHLGDVGYRDSDGYLWFVGRSDDVISSAGYRIGPGEIENCALAHPAVEQVAAIGVPDPEGLRGDIVKLCVVLREGQAGDAAMEASLQQHVRERLAAYEYPRLVAFMDSLPLTTSGKVQRNVLRQWHVEESEATR